ncbi:MAG: hypothetical protein MRY83_17800 [Flavobacteriales bacterium]|nr:hypothetical protein [Flavobacteriales bacterium]
MKIKPLIIGFLIGIILVRLFSYLSDVKSDVVAIDASISELNGLVGKWEASTDAGKYLEIWEKDTITNNLKGGAFLLDEKGDTVFRETLNLVSINDKLGYIATIGNKVTLFSLTEKTEGFSFSNFEHDYPKQLLYKISENKINVDIIGSGLFGDSSEKLELIRK